MVQPEQLTAAEMLMTVALRLCYRPTELMLSEEQVIIRRFTPLPSYTIACLSRLERFGAIQIDDISMGLIGLKSVRAVKKPSFDLPVWLRFRSKESFRMDLFVKEFGVADCILQLHREASACEAIEYADYYVNRANLHLKNLDPFNEKLGLLLLELPLEKVHALLWRAVKIISLDKCANDPVEFSDVAESAFDMFLKYTKQNTIIEDYERPRGLKNSTLSSLLQIYWRRAVGGSD